VQRERERENEGSLARIGEKKDCSGARERERKK
jgi:hypothetical protein